PHRLRPQAQGEAAGDGAVRRLRLGAQRVALHAPVRLLAPGPLLEGAELHLRRRGRRDHAPLPGARHQRRDRGGAPRRRHQRLRHSDFGRAFKAFHRDFLPAVNKRTTVIILGDGRNNYNLPHDWVLKDLQQRAKQVVWLNPENKMTWGFGDSEMDRYAPYCTLVEECRNLNQLYHVIDRLVAV